MRNPFVYRCMLTWLHRLAISFFLCLGLIPAARAQDKIESQVAQCSATGTRTLQNSTRIGQEHKVALTTQGAAKRCP